MLVICLKSIPLRTKIILIPVYFRDSDKNHMLKKKIDIVKYPIHPDDYEKHGKNNYLFKILIEKVALSKIMNCDVSRY